MTTGPGMGRSWRALCMKWKGPDGWNVAGECLDVSCFFRWLHWLPISRFFLATLLLPGPKISQVIFGFRRKISISGKEVKQHGGSWKACQKDQWMPFRYSQYYLQEAWRMANHQSFLAPCWTLVFPPISMLGGCPTTEVQLNFQIGGLLKISGHMGLPCFTMFYYVLPEKNHFGWLALPGPQFRETLSLQVSFVRAFRRMVEVWRGQALHRQQTTSGSSCVVVQLYGCLFAG